MQPVLVKQGASPVILAFPHCGTHVPDHVASRLNENGRILADTDWHVTALYDGLLPAATTVQATFHRYVIDANRDPEGESLYPGQNTTSLCPHTDFDGKPIWQPGAEPSPHDVQDRLTSWHVPYHAALAAEVTRVKEKHGIALVYDCHSIRSRIPFLFEGELPVLNIGTDNGRTCAKNIEDNVCRLASASPHSMVLNGHFRGGWTTRHYGRPETGVHAIQMEIAQLAYLETESPPWQLSAGKAEVLRRCLADILGRIHVLALEMSHA